MWRIKNLLWHQRQERKHTRTGRVPQGMTRPSPCHFSKAWRLIVPGTKQHCLTWFVSSVVPMCCLYFCSLIRFLVLRPIVDNCSSLGSHHSMLRNNLPSLRQKRVIGTFSLHWLGTCTLGHMTWSRERKATDNMWTICDEKWSICRPLVQSLWGCNVVVL